MTQIRAAEGGAVSIAFMRQRTLFSTLLAAALVAGPWAATAQDFDDDFGGDFDDDFDDDGFDDDGFDDDFGDDDFDDDDFDDNDAAANSAGERGLGIGAIAPLAGVGGIAGFFGVGAAPAVDYDMGDYHIDAHLIFATGEAGGPPPIGGDVTTIGLGGRFWYHLFAHDASDLSVGGGLSFVNVNPDGADSSTSIFAEAGGKIRMFLVPQVALSSSFGLVLGLADADGIALGGQVLGGITYYID